jgi:hypothetical protein
MAESDKYEVLEKIGEFAIHLVQPASSHPDRHSLLTLIVYRARLLWYNQQGQEEI